MSSSSLDINIGSGLIKYQYLVLPEQGPCQTHQLFLTHTEVGPSFCDLPMKLSLQLFNYWLQLNLGKSKCTSNQLQKAGFNNNNR